MSTLGLRCLCVLWPSFLAAGILEVVVLAVFSPSDLTWGRDHLDVSATTVYSLAFFVFWLVAAVSSWMTVILNMPKDELNRKPE